MFFPKFDWAVLLIDHNVKNYVNYWNKKCWLTSWTYFSNNFQYLSTRKTDIACPITFVQKYYAFNNNN